MKKKVMATLLGGALVLSTAGGVLTYANSNSKVENPEVNRRISADVEEDTTKNKLNYDEFKDQIIKDIVSADSKQF